MEYSRLEKGWRLLEGSVVYQKVLCRLSVVVSRFPALRSSPRLSLTLLGVYCKPYPRAFRFHFSTSQNPCDTMQARLRLGFRVRLL